MPERRLAAGWADCARNAFDRAAAALGLVLLAPLLLLLAAAVVLESGGPALFRHQRVGRGGRLFRLLKFRSMRAGVSGPQITAAGDRRVTRVGAVLRRYKLDELPQLWNVLRGEMSLVGPRPEVPEFVDAADPAWRRILAVRPGITDLATLTYRDEEQLLGRGEPYAVILPVKLALNCEYLARRSFGRDLKLILLTARYSFLPGRCEAARVRRILGIDHE